jgi:cell division protein FtsI/penicillin-binding protein 2
MASGSFKVGVFQRRVLLFVALAGMAGSVLAAQLWRLTTVEHAGLTADAEAKLRRISWIQTTRGRILDRKGRVLAQDRPSFGIAVDYEVLSGQWAVKQAGRYARRVHGSQWTKLSAREREALIDRYMPAYTAHVEQMWRQLSLASGVSGDALVRRQDEILERIARTHRVISTARTRQLLDSALARGEEITTEVEQRVGQVASQAIREQRVEHLVLPRLSEAAAFELMRIEGRTVEVWPGGSDSGAADVVSLLPGVRVIDSGVRDYPMDRMEVEVDLSSFPGPLREEGASGRVSVTGVGIHVIGAMRDTLFREDAERRAAALASDAALRDRALTERGTDRGEYQPGDGVGRGGIEESQEAVLRGLRGFVTTRLDTGERTTIQPTPGQDVRLTIDVALQARVQAILDPKLGLAVAQPWHGDENPTVQVGTALNGAVVVLDVDTGEILSMVSTPTYTRGQLREDPETLFSDPVGVAWLNRCVARPYPPGSIVKPLTLIGAVARGNYQIGQRIACDGHLFPGRPDMFRCWIYKRFGTTHNVSLGHSLAGREAIAVSCNIFFYTLGQRLGPEGIAAVYKSFGLGMPFNLGIGQEFSGFLGPSGNESALQISDAIFMGMGQGPVAWTPLHAAHAYATLARSGVSIPPRIVAGSSAVPEESSFDSRAIDEAIGGLDDAVNLSSGTGHSIAFEQRRERIFNVPGVHVWGKTGTAEAPAIIVDPDGEGPEKPVTLRQGDHSWFVVMAAAEGESRPRYVVSVMMEYAGSGGKVSGPIANQVLHALRMEGYL